MKLHYLLPLLVGLCACTSDGPEKFDLDIAKAETVTLPAADLLPLEANDSSLIYEIASLDEAQGRYVIWSRNLLRSFNAKTGAYMGDVAKRGQGPGEFRSPMRVWLTGDTVNLWDFAKRMQMKYLVDGTFVGADSVFHRPQDRFTPTPNIPITAPDGSGFYSMNTFMSISNPYVESYSKYDKHGNYVADVIGRFMQTGASLNDRFTMDATNKRILTWEALKDTIFAIEDTVVKPAYIINFGNNTFPADKQAFMENTDRMESFYKGTSIPYIGFINHLRVVGDNLYFSISNSNKQYYLVRLNDRTGKYKIVDFAEIDGYKFDGYYTVIGNDFVMSFTNASNPDANPAIVRQPLSLLD